MNTMDRDTRIARLVTALLSYPAMAAIALVLALCVRACPDGRPLVDPLPPGAERAVNR